MAIEYKLPFTAAEITEKLKNSGVSSWNDLTDKPFGEETVIGDTLVWDGNMTGKVYVEIELPNGDEGDTVPCYFVKLSDSVPTIEDLQNGGSYAVFGGIAPFSGDEVADLGDALMIGEAAFVIKEDDADLTDILGLIFPEKGVYVFHAPLMGITVTSLTINGYNKFVNTSIKKIEDKYLPSFDETYRTYFYQGEKNGAYYSLYSDADKLIPATYQDIEQAYYKGQIVIRYSSMFYYIPTEVRLVPPVEATLVALNNGDGNEPAGTAKFIRYRVGSAD